ncbi:unnamed protein product [marine sediment metagenome]|uniref:Uncharacterized protein n=1 Tax=marine sediment metagenome TaxID=412755 RepID=X0TQS9_9ZZZZ
MPVGSKIDRDGLGPEILNLRQGGMSYHNIADAVNSRHPELSEPISFMAVKRFLVKEKVRLKVERLENGDDLDEALRATFRDKLYDLEDETHEIYSIMRKALKGIVKEQSNMNIIRAAKDVLQSIEQTRKNWASLIQFGINEFREDRKAKEMTTVNIDKLLIEISNELSPDARRELVNVVLSKNDKKDKKKIKEELEEYGRR